MTATYTPIKPDGNKIQVLDKEHFADLDKFGGSHWWYRGKNELIRMLLAKPAQGAATNPKLIDVGCGAGNLSQLLARDSYNVTSVDLSPDAIYYCKLRGLQGARVADATVLPFKAESFDCAVASEILEHINNDSLALSEICRVLKPGGRLIITVPAVRALFGPHDIYWQHIRRYSREDFISLINSADFRVLKISYFNFLLFGPIAVLRFFGKFAGGGNAAGISSPDLNDDYKFNGRLMNALLYCALSAERTWLRYFNFPIGVSLVAVLEKNVLRRQDAHL